MSKVRICLLQTSHPLQCLSSSAASTDVEAKSTSLIHLNDDTRALPSTSCSMPPQTSSGATADMVTDAYDLRYPCRALLDDRKQKSQEHHATPLGNESRDRPKPDDHYSRSTKLRRFRHRLRNERHSDGCVEPCPQSFERFQRGRSNVQHQAAVRHAARRNPTHRSRRHRRRRVKERPGTLRVNTVVPPWYKIRRTARPQPTTTRSGRFHSFLGCPHRERRERCRGRHPQAPHNLHNISRTFLNRTHFSVLPKTFLSPMLSGSPACY